MNKLGFDNKTLSQYASSLRGKYDINGKVLLVQAPQFLFKSFNVHVARNRAYYAYPPTGLQCIAKALRCRGLEVDILDLNYAFLKKVTHDRSFDYRDWLTILEERLDRTGPSIVGVTSINVYSDVFEQDYPLTAIMRLLRDRDEGIVIAGGPIALNEYENYLMKDLCHFVIASEGENKIKFLFDYLLDDEYGQPPVKGIYFKTDGKIEQTSGRDDTVTLKGNLIDTYDLVPIEDYNSVGSLNPYSRMAGQERRFAVFQLNRGCRANCKFCGVRDFMGKGVRQYSVKDVLHEIRYLVREKGIRHFDVLDDDFLVNRHAVIDLLCGLAELKKEFDITWSSNNGLIAASINEELMALMRESGCVGFRIGVETGNPEMLVNMRKPANINSLKRAAAILNRYPAVFTGGNYIIGLLGQETFGEMLDTFYFANELNLDWASYAVFQFTSAATMKAENISANGRTATDFVPSKSDIDRKITGRAETVSGFDVFDIPPESVPSPGQINEIWFAFNLGGNYINNKNLKAGGDPAKFTSWIEAVMAAYPHNPYMPLFAALGYVLQENGIKARSHLAAVRENLRGAEYWNRRFDQFGLTPLVKKFPRKAEEVYEALGLLQNKLMPKACVY